VIEPEGQLRNLSKKKSSITVGISDGEIISCAAREPFFSRDKPSILDPWEQKQHS
jgi:hypothetical protein